MQFFVLVFMLNSTDELAKDAKKSELMLKSSGIVKCNKSDNFASVCSKRGQKGIDRDCALVWEVYIGKSSV